MIKTIPLWIFLFIVTGTTAPAQEFVSGLVKNPTIIAASQKSGIHLKNSMLSPDTLELPFFDDFASTTIFPDQRLWTDNYVYINSNFAVNPITIGVATFDALDANGHLYSNASYTSFLADKLTSHFINLAYPPDSDIFLSFFYQPQGLGHMPGNQDSLMVQFYAPLQSKWITVWKIPGDSLRPFRQALIHVSDTTFLHKTFRFRFMNYATLSKSVDDPGRVGDNSDWNIDYVYLNKGRSSQDSLIDDVALTEPLPSLLTTFESIPWTHFPYAANELMAAGKIPVVYKNYFNLVRSIERSFSIKSEYSSYFYAFPSNQVNVPPYSFQTYQPLIEKLPYEGNDSARFDVLFYLYTDSVSTLKQYRWNDTIRRTQNFYDFYAYDDGTAENGYGLIGQGTKNARVAYQFYAYKPDSLRAIQMYFNDVFNDANVKNFNLTVWDAGVGQPGDILFSRSDSAFKPVFNYRNQFVTYFLDQPLAIQDTFYVGWIQNTDGFLNVGLDVNHVNNTRMFYNINGIWKTSSIKGSLLIRPVFGKRLLTDVSKMNVNSTFRIYPNPAEDFINVISDGSMSNKARLLLYDNTGKLLFSIVNSGEPIDISTYANGIYILKIEPEQGTQIYRKILILR